MSLNNPAIKAQWNNTFHPIQNALFGDGDLSVKPSDEAVLKRAAEIYGKADQNSKDNLDRAIKEVQTREHTRALEYPEVTQTEKDLLRLLKDNSQKIGRLEKKQKALTQVADDSRPLLDNSRYLSGGGIDRGMTKAEVLGLGNRGSADAYQIKTPSANVGH